MCPFFGDQWSALQRAAGERTRKLHEQECNTTFINLLTIRGDVNIPATAYVREFFETARCDDVSDMAPLRADLSEKIEKYSPGAMQRIETCVPTDHDETAAAQAVIHYHIWQEEKLTAALTGQSWLSYHALQRVERTAATVGVITGLFVASPFLYTGMKSVHTSFRKMNAERVARKALEQQQQRAPSRAPAPPSSAPNLPPGGSDAA